MSIITIIDQNADWKSVGAACIDAEDFTAVVAPWFGAADGDTTKLDPSIREEFRDLAEIVEGGEAWTDEEAGELCRSLGLDVEVGTADVENTIPVLNAGLASIPVAAKPDTIVVTAPQSGKEIARVQVAASEDTEPYDEALRAAGFAHFSWID